MNSIILYITTLNPVTPEMLSVASQIVPIHIASLDTSMLMATIRRMSQQFVVSHLKVAQINSKMYLQTTETTKCLLSVQQSITISVVYKVTIVLVRIWDLKRALINFMYKLLICDTKKLHRLIRLVCTILATMKSIWTSLY